MKYFLLLLKKDLKREARSRETITSMLVYAILVLVVFGVAFSQAGSTFNILEISGGLFWVLIVFTSLLGLNRSFAVEKENGCVEGLMLAPIDRSLIFLAKMTSNFLFLLLVEVVTLPLFFFFFLESQTISGEAVFCIAPLLLGTFGIAGVGTLLSTITINTRGRDVMLALLMIPLIFPLLYACVSSTSLALVGLSDGMDLYIAGVVIALAFDVIMTLISWLLYDLVLSA